METGDVEEKIMIPGHLSYKIYALLTDISFLVGQSIGYDICDVKMIDD
jgi:hypothetical protein